MAASGLQLSDWSPGNGWVGRPSFASRLGGEVCARSTDAERRRLSGGQARRMPRASKDFEGAASGAYDVAFWAPSPAAAGTPFNGRPIPPRGVVCRPRTKHLLQITTFGRWTLTPGAERLHKRFRFAPCRKGRLRPPAYMTRVCQAAPGASGQGYSWRPLERAPCVATIPLDEESRFHVGRDMKIATH